MANSFLPDFTKSCLAENGAKNLEDLEHYLVKVAVDEEIVQSKVLGRLLRVIQTRLDLKYDTDDALRSRILSVLLDTYRNRRCPIPLKTRLLSVAGRVCKNKRHDIRLAAPLDWEFHWEELISVCTRSKKYEEIASEVVLGKLLQTQVAFLHSARRFLSDAEGRRVVERAMCQLQDPRHSSSVEGLFLLVICLPTGYAGYVASIHEWLSVWSRVEHNALWDACWLTLLCRARKSQDVYRSFDWSHMFPFLLTKTKELLNLPGPVSSRPANPSAYPSAIPGQYLFLGCTSPFDARKTALHKVAKLLYSHCFYSFNGAPFELVPAAPLPISHSIPKDAGAVTIPGLNASTQCVLGARDLATFYGSIRVYFHPSNTGSWSQDLGFLLGTQIGELARHVGREVAIRHGNLQSEYLKSVVRTPLHEATVEYLIGLFSSLLLEMLYSKNFILSHIAAHGLKNLAPLCPALCGAIVPGLVATLDPAAVSKSHMALPAMTALSITFKSFLFPDPVILQYLPAILQLTLPGIDPNDDKKTLLALTLYSKILAWVPIGESAKLKSSDSPALLPLALGHSAPAAGSTGTAALLESTKAAMVEWAPAFLDRILALIDATEDSNQHTVDGSGASSRRHRSGSARERKGPSRRLQTIEDCLRLFFAGMDGAVADEMCGKVLNHVRSANPLHAAKEYTALLCTMLSSHPNRLLERTLSDLLDSGLQAGECSSEKLAFRLHLAGGIVRRSTCTELLRPRPYGGAATTAIVFLQPFVQPGFTVKHPDIRVQEAARKLIRDLLRGLSAVVPLETSPVHQADWTVLGETSPERSSVVAWHVPTADGVSAAAALLTTCCDDAMAAVTDITTGVSATATKKAAEDDLIAHLSVIHACCRGAADILGDVERVDSSLSTDNGEDDEEGTFTVVSTGRNKIVAACGDSSVIACLSQTRDRILRTLLSLQETLNRGDVKNIFHESPGGAGSNTASMSPDVAALWMRVFEAVVMHRSWLKEASSAKQSFSANKRQGTNSTARYAKRVLERFGDRSSGQTGSPTAKNYSDSFYWERYDLPAYASSDRGLIQYSLIANEYGHSSARASIHGSCQDAPLLTRCFNQLVILCSHEFESIRKDALHCFNKMTGFGWKLEDLVLPLIRNLTTAGISYPIASGTLSILSCPLVMKRMVSRWPLMQLFLEAVPGTNAMFSGVEDMDKRQRLVELFAGVFVKYVEKWSHLPLQAKATDDNAESERESASVFLKKMCEEVLKLSPPVAAELTILSSPLEGSSSAMDTDNAAVPSSPSISSSIRHELYMAYVVMHLIGHRDIVVPAEAWIWAIRQVCTRRGHPVAVLAMAVLSRLAYTAAVSTVPPNSEGQWKSNAHVPCVPVPNVVLDILGNEAVWKALLEGFSSIGMKKSGDSAQWSNGIDRILRSADYIQQGYPRWITNNLFHNKTAGGAFRPAEASLICCLFLVCPSSGLVPSKVSAVLDASKGLVASNEEEATGHNTLRANLFGALSRLLQASYNTGSDRAPDLDPIDDMLKEFLVQQTQSISLSYCYDWADAISFGFSSSRVKMTGCGTIPGVIVANARVVLTALSGSKDAAASEDSDDGFSRHAKQLVLTKGLLNADLSVVAACGAENFDIDRDPSVQSHRQHFLPEHSISSVLFSLRHSVPNTSALSTSSEVAMELSKLFLNDSCSFVSSYRNVRVEIVEILHMLSCAHIDSRTEKLKGVVEKLRRLTDTSNVSDSAENSKVHNAIEIGILWLELASSNTTYRSADVLEGLLSVALVGSGCSDIDLAKRCHTTSLRAASLIARGISGPEGEYSRWPGSVSTMQSNGVFAGCLKCFIDHFKVESWRVRATAVFALTIVLANNWADMCLIEKKECKNIFNEAFYDQKPEIQLLGRAGMTVYLSTKLLSELNTLASAYKKNNDIFAAREKKKRLALAAGGSVEGVTKGTDKVDNVYITTIFMSAAMLAAFPYDLPEFAPSLLHSLLRHSNVHFFHDTVTRTVQDFKRTHQDRWDEEFKKHFSSDQLEDLQGAGAQTYFT